MDRTTLNTRLERIQNEISKLVNTLYALNLTDSDTYPQNYEELSTDAALRAEKIACTLRNLTVNLSHGNSLYICRFLHQNRFGYQIGRVDQVAESTGDRKSVV